MKASLILIGYMGCGKTTIGQQLAKSLGLPFADTDQLIEKKEGCTISHIFATLGEEAFRNMETVCLRELIESGSEGVLSVGGGLPLRKENQKLLKKLGRVVYLQAQPETIYERVKNDTSRPLLKTEDPQKRIIEMLEVRGPIYLETADLVIQTDGKEPDEIVSETIEKIRKEWLKL